MLTQARLSGGPVTVLQAASRMSWNVGGAFVVVFVEQQKCQGTRKKQTETRFPSSTKNEPHTVQAAKAATVPLSSYDNEMQILEVVH